MIKKILVVILCLVTILSLTACSGSNESSDENIVYYSVEKALIKKDDFAKVKIIDKDFNIDNFSISNFESMGFEKGEVWNVVNEMNASGNIYKKDEQNIRLAISNGSGISGIIVDENSPECEFINGIKVGMSDMEVFATLNNFEVFFSNSKIEGTSGGRYWVHHGDHSICVTINNEKVTEIFMGHTQKNSVAKTTEERLVLVADNFHKNEYGKNKKDTWYGSLINTNCDADISIIKIGEEEFDFNKMTLSDVAKLQYEYKEMDCRIENPIYSTMIIENESDCTLKIIPSYSHKLEYLEEVFNVKHDETECEFFNGIKIGMSKNDLEKATSDLNAKIDKDCMIIKNDKNILAIELSKDKVVSISLTNIEIAEIK